MSYVTEVASSKLWEDPTVTIEEREEAEEKVVAGASEVEVEDDPDSNGDVLTDEEVRDAVLLPEPPEVPRGTPRLSW